MKQNLKLLAIGTFFGLTVAGNTPVMADRFFDEYRSDYEICMYYCKADNNTDTYCKGLDVCGSYSKK